MQNTRLSGAVHKIYSAVLVSGQTLSTNVMKIHLHFFYQPCWQLHAVMDRQMECMLWPLCFSWSKYCRHWYMDRTLLLIVWLST